LFHAVEILAVFALRRPAETCAHRVNEHEVRFVEQRIFVVHQMKRRRRQTAVILQENAPRPQHSEMQPDR